jgi:hypothetical protein
MAHDVFISHSSKDKVYADAVCARLESEGIRCWIAPRDILPGMAWGEAIVEAIETSRLMVLLFSSNANSSPQIEREVGRALNKQVTIVPLRIESVMPGKSLEYFLGTPHWLDAVTPPFERHLEYIAQTIKVLLHRGEPGQAEEIPRPPAPPPPSPRKFAPPKPGPILIGAAGVAVVVLLAVLGWWLLGGGPVPRKFVGSWTNTNFIGPDKVQFTLKVGNGGTYRYEVKYKESGKVNISKGQMYLETADGLERPVGPVAAATAPPTPSDLVEAVPDGVWDMMSRFSQAKAEPPQDNPFYLVQSGKPGPGTTGEPAVWEWDTAFGKVAWQMKFEFGFDGRYSFIAKATDLGHFEAREGKWKAASDISDNKAEGGYSFVGDDSLVMAGTLRGAVPTSAAGNTLWERIGSAQAAPAPGVAAQPSITPTPAPTAAAAAPASSGGPATATPTPAPTPSPSATATPRSQPIMAIDKRFLLSHDTNVYAGPDSSSAVVSQLRRGRWVHITGLTGNWLRIQLYNRADGFIPDEAVE